jgi:hypothetical protein
MSPLPLTRQLPARSLPTQSDLRLVLRPRKPTRRPAHVAPQVCVFREEKWQGGVEGPGRLCERESCGCVVGGGGCGHGHRRVVCKGGFVHVEVELRVEIEVTDQREA